jgi:DNA-directed RNA polymerase subunit beta'
LSYLDPKEASENLQQRVLEGIRSQFPDGVIKGKLQSLHLEGLTIKDDLDPGDIRDQHKARLEGRTWSVPVYADLSLRDNATGKVVDARRMRIADIPKMTQRYSYVVASRSGAKEYQVNNQWQLKPGVYTQRRTNGELETRFNIKNRKSFDVVFDPASKVFHMEYGKSASKIPLYSLVKTLGADDATLEKAWGKEVFEANKDAAKKDNALNTFYKSTKKEVAPNREIAAAHFYDMMTASTLRPDSTELTLGKPFEHVTGDALTRATQKLLRVQGGEKEDDRESLIFKDLRSVGDFAYERILEAGRKGIQRKVASKISTAKNVRDVIQLGMFNKPILETFQKNAAAGPAAQINPVEMLAASFQTTVMGPGGIQSDRQIKDEVKFVNVSHLGFLDPINTPEGASTGVTLRLPFGLQKVDHMVNGEPRGEARIPLYNLKTHKLDLVSPGEASKVHIVLPDQVRWENGVPKPIADSVQMTGGGDDVRHGKFSEAQYVVRSPSQLFNMTSNLLPFLANTSGGRASMASRHMEQAISLVHRAPPLVQVGTGSSLEGGQTFEHLMGGLTSHVSPVNGKVTAVKKDGVTILSDDGKSHEVQIYDNFPVNEAKGVLDSTPIVKVGDHVKKKQVVADTNYSKNGVLALGNNLRVAYIPFKGYNFEDGVVISQSAAEALSSAHMHKPSMPLDDAVVLDKKKFLLEHHGLYNKEQISKLDDRGIIQVGQKVKPGDPLIAAMKPYQLKDRTGLAAIRRVMSASHTDKSLRWDSEFEGDVVGVHHTKDGVTVHVRTVEPMQVGDKMAGRYGNKGIVTMILPNVEMPHTKDGKHIEVALNPSGVPGRMNVGQVLETAAGKIAQKTGKPYIVQNFQPKFDALHKVIADLKAHDISDTEELFDPATKQSLGKALVGPQHLLKLVHQVEKKLSVRSGMNVPGMQHEGYDLNLQPLGGSGTGGPSIGGLDLYALLAHGAKANLREMQTYKSEGPDPQTDPRKAWPSDHNKVWAAIQSGGLLPPPKPTFAYQKFTDMLRAAGVNVDKNGHSIALSPMTDAQVLELAPKALPHPAERVNTKIDAKGELKPKTGGLFDERLTGGHGGKHWTRIELSEPLPNPFFERAIRSVAQLSSKEFESVVHGERGVSPSGQLTDLKAGVTGGAGIKLLLDRVDVRKELPLAQMALDAAKGVKIDPALKRVKFLRALSGLRLKPSEAYILHNLPVIPPIMRPITPMPDGNLKPDDLNQLYSDFAKVNDKLKDPIWSANLTDEGKRDMRFEYYDGVKALMGVGAPYGDVKEKGILHRIAGSSPKHGYFQHVLLRRRQDLSMRSTIVPEPSLGLDEVGLPKAAALDLYRPFVSRKLKEMGAVRSELEVPPLLAKPTPQVWRALDKAMAEHPVLLKRDPVLHKYSIQAFKPHTVEGSAIKIHPLVTGGFNADFDGDTMSAYVPITREAVAEARKMFPSNNLFSDASGKSMYQPTLESALGLYKLSVVGKDTGKKFSNPAEVLQAAQKGTIDITDKVHLPGGETTPGRVLLASAVPEPLEKHMMHNMEYRLDNASKKDGGTKGLDALLMKIAKEHSDSYGSAVNKLKDLGNGASFGSVMVPRPTSVGHPFAFSKLDGTHVAVTDPSKSIFIPMPTHSLSLKDFVPDVASRERVLGPAEEKAKGIRADTKLTKAQQDHQVVKVYEQAATDMQKLHVKSQEAHPTNLFTMYKAGVKPGWDQYKQMVLAPMIYLDAHNRPIPNAVTKSYSEGLDMGSYWTQLHGARRGQVMKVQEVEKPGALSKVLMQNMMNVLVNEHDCGTKDGIQLSINEPDVHDRYLQKDFIHGKVHISANSPLTPADVGKIRAVDPHAFITVRSPLKCEEEHGVCQKCAGLTSGGQHYELGTNVGVQAAHAVGERAVQLTLKSFHTGGVGEQNSSKLLSAFAHFDNLLRLPKKLANQATISAVSGTVDKVQPTATGVDIYVGGKKHHVGKDAGGFTLHENLPGAVVMSDYIDWSPPKVGMKVAAGAYLSDPNRTVLNPHHLYAATGSMDRVQDHLTTSIFNLYKNEGLKRRAIEMVVKSMGSLTRVEDPGDHDSVLRGEFRPLPVVRKMNEELIREHKAPIEHTPVLKGIDVMPRELHEDWMAKLQHNHLRETLQEAAAVHGVSLIHGHHPVPALAFGSEIGLSKKDSLMPGRGHLKDVADHLY